jgi:hypothetical protein
VGDVEVLISVELNGRRLCLLLLCFYFEQMRWRRGVGYKDVVESWDK